MHPAYPFTVERKGPIIAESGFGAIYPKLHHGLVPYGVPRDWRESWRSFGRLVIGWGWLTTEPELEAQLAVRLCQDLDLDGYIANAEFDYEGENAGRSERFVAEFRRLAPRAPLALSGLIANAPWVRAFDYTPWIEAGAFFRPQSYDALSDIPVSETLAYCDRAGWSRDRVMPDLLTSGSHDTAGDVEALVGADTKGFGFFLGSNALDDDYRIAGQRMREDGIGIPL